MKIYGYSERGVINSLIYNIGDDKKLLLDFINLINIPRKLNIGEPDDCEILIEQSLSQFGDCDLIIILKYNATGSKIVLFFEAKVKTAQGRWNLESEYNKFKAHNPNNNRYSSNLFFQLYSKSLLINKFAGIKTEAVDIDGKCRKIGKNKVVHKAIEMIGGFDKAYYVAIVPTLTNDLKSFLNANDLKLKYKIHFLSWKRIYDFCVENNLNDVLEVFKFNKTQIF